MTTKEGGLRGSIRNIEVGVSIPDSVINRWPVQEGSGSTVEDTVGTSDISLSGDPQWESGTWRENYILRFDGVDDYGESDAQTPPGSMTSVATIDFNTDITDIQTISDFGSPASGDVEYRGLRFNGSISTNTIEIVAINDSEDRFTATAIVSQGTHRVAHILDTVNDELRLGVDGSVVDTTAITGSFTNQNTVENHKVSRRTNSPDWFFTGGIDEIMLADEAWDASTLQDDFDNQPWS